MRFVLNKTFDQIIDFVRVRHIVQPLSVTLCLQSMHCTTTRSKIDAETMNSSWIEMDKFKLFKARVESFARRYYNAFSNQDWRPSQKGTSTLTHKILTNIRSIRASFLPASWPIKTADASAVDEQQKLYQRLSEIGWPRSDQTPTLSGLQRISPMKTSYLLI